MPTKPEKANDVIMERIFGKFPTLSVLMGVYYQRTDLSLLKRSVHSILKQEYSDFEFLICDDGSTKKAQFFLESLSQTDRRIRLIRRENRFHLAEKLNICLEHAQGDIIARMDDDDNSHPDRFSKQIEALRTNPGIAFVGSNIELYRAGQHIGTKTLPEWPTAQDFFITQPYIHPTLVFRKAPLISVGGYSEDRRCLLCEDYDLLLRLYARGYQGMNLQESLLDYTLPLTAKGRRTIGHRWNEAVTRYQRFQELHLLPGAFPYVLKPLAVGLLPEAILKKLKGMPQ